MAAYRFARAAENDIDSILSTIRADNLAAAEKWFTDLVTKCCFLADFPRAGRVRNDLLPDICMFPFGKYLIFHDMEDAGIVVLHVVDVRRDVRHLSQ